MTALPGDICARGGGSGPGAGRGVVVLGGLAVLTWWLSLRGGTGEDQHVTRLGRIELTARLLDRPDEFPDLGAYRYTWVLPYEVVQVHRQDPAGGIVLRPGDRIFVGHYKPWLPREGIRDEDWGDSPLGGSLSGFVAGENHRMALDWPLLSLAPSGALDSCYPPEVHRFFAIWSNPAGP